MIKYNDIESVKAKAVDFYEEFIELNGYNDRGLEVFCEELLNSIIPYVGKADFERWERHFIRYMEKMPSTVYMRLARDQHRVFSVRRGDGLVLPCNWTGLCCSLVYGLGGVKFCLGVCNRSILLFTGKLNERVEQVSTRGELYYIPKEYMTVIRYLSGRGYIATLWDKESLLKLLSEGEYAN